MVGGTLNSSWESVADLLARYPTLGIPHFQRGLVWGTDSVALLLESLFWSTPCGSVILWEPEDPGGQGIPLATDHRPRHLIVDGQQRIRSLWNVFGGTSSGGDLIDLPEDESPPRQPDERAPRVWCVDLTHVPSLAPHFGPPSRFSLFRVAVDPTDPRARVRKGFVPLSWLRSGETRDVEAHIREHHGVDAAEAFLLSGLGARLRDMTSEPLFALRVLEETGEQNRLADVVAVFNRINSGGRRVEAEERAYASLVSYAPGAKAWLGRLFQDIHGSRSGGSEVAQHDDVLQRRKERSFGFKLFLRTFVQVASYHTGYSIGSSAFSFDQLASDGFHRPLSSPENAAKVDEMLSRTGQVLVFIRRVLAEKLHCDDLRMLPETSSLWPVIQLLLRFPALMEESTAAKTDRAIAALLLRLYLAPRETRKLLELVAAVNRAHTARECVAHLSRSLTAADVAARMREGLHRSTSLQDRYVLLLYWLQRRLGAKDLSYVRLDQLGRRRFAASELDLCEAAEPEKQHLVPYSRIAMLYEISGRARVGAHAVNGIGNLTFISRLLNGFEQGLGSDPIDITLEPAENSRAHFFTGADGFDLTDAFVTAVAADSRAKFEEFCAARRELIAQSFVAWLEATESDLLCLDDALRIEPCERHFLITDADRVRRMDYPEVLEDAVLRWLTIATPRRRTGAKQPGAREVYRARTGPRIGLTLYPDRIEIEALDPVEIQRLESALSSSDGVVRVPEAAQRWSVSTNPEIARVTAAVIRAATGESGPH